MNDSLVMVPTVHINGTGAKDLKDPIEEAVNKLRDAEKALREVSPNARDYYVQGDFAYSEARRQHEARQTKLQEITDELSIIWRSIDDQEESHAH